MTRAAGAGVAAGVVAALAIACTEPGAPPAVDPPLLTAPIAGEPMVDIFYGAYVDHAPGGGVMDYACGIKAYNGHRGVDILLRNFQVQDTGVAVLAAAPGLVSAVVDWLPDRNTERVAGGLGNHVVVTHVGGLRTVYGHLRRESIVVAQGQQVERGQTIGEVGSSGFSNWPHLHFEVRSLTAVLEPFAGPCGPGHSLWLDQLPYQDQFMVTDAGVTDQLPLTMATLLERPANIPAVEPGTDSVGVWIQLANQRAATVRAEAIPPDSEEPAWVMQGNVTATYSMRFLWGTIPIAGILDTPGAWEIRWYQNSLLIHVEPLVVPGSVASARSRPVTAAGARTSALQIDDQAGAGPHPPR